MALSIPIQYATYTRTCIHAPIQTKLNDVMHDASCVLQNRCTCATPVYSYAPAHRLCTAFMHAPYLSSFPLSLPLILTHIHVHTLPLFTLFSVITLVFRISATIPNTRLSDANDFLLCVANDSHGKLGALLWSKLTNFRFVSGEFAWKSLLTYSDNSTLCWKHENYFTPGDHNFKKLFARSIHISSYISYITCQK